MLGRRWRVVFGAVLIQLCLGAIYAWSVFTPALREAGWTNLQTQMVFSLGLASFAIVMVIAGKKLSSWGPRRLAVSGGLVLAAGYLMAGISGGTEFLPVLIGVGLVGGAGIGLGYVVPIAVGMRWFPDRKGMITGVAVAGFGFGALGWIKLAGEWGELISRFGLGGTFVIYGILFGGLVLIGSQWMAFPPEGWVPDGYIAPKGANAGTENYTSREMLRTPQFHLISLTFAVSAGAGLMAIGLMKLYPVEALVQGGMPAAEASAIAGTAMAVFFSLANGVGRLAWGILSDRLGRKLSIIVMAATQGLLMFAFIPMAGSEYLLYLAAALIGFNFGGNFALFPAITADRFGNATVGANYPWVFLAYGFGGIFFPILGGWLGDLESFPLAFSICGAACVVGAVAAFLVFPPHHDESEHRFTLKRFVHNAHLFEKETRRSRPPRSQPTPATRSKPTKRATSGQPTEPPSTSRLDPETKFAEPTPGWVAGSRAACHLSRTRRSSVGEPFTTSLVGGCAFGMPLLLRATSVGRCPAMDIGRITNHVRFRQWIELPC